MFKQLFLNLDCHPGKICSSSPIWQLSITTTACTWRITCSLWATISKLTCCSPSARASPRLSTWCQGSGGLVNEDLTFLSETFVHCLDFKNIFKFGSLAFFYLWKLCRIFACRQVFTLLSPTPHHQFIVVKLRCSSTISFCCSQIYPI